MSNDYYKYKLKLSTRLKVILYNVFFYAHSYATFRRRESSSFASSVWEPQLSSDGWRIPGDPPTPVYVLLVDCFTWWKLGLSLWSAAEGTGALPLCPAHYYCDLIARSASRAARPVRRVPNDTSYGSLISLESRRPRSPKRSGWHDPKLGFEQIFSFFFLRSHHGDNDVTRCPLLPRRSWHKTCNSTYLIARSCVISVIALCWS